MDENAIGERVLGCALSVHRALGPRLLESAYEACLAHELRKAGLEFKRQLTLPLIYDGVAIETGYGLDLLVADLVVIEVKAVEAVARSASRTAAELSQVGRLPPWLCS